MINKSNIFLGLRASNYSLPIEQYPILNLGYIFNYNILYISYLFSPFSHSSCIDIRTLQSQTQDDQKEETRRWRKRCARNGD